jgi:uncharacterized repeat protein (TIGR02543 family)
VNNQKFANPAILTSVGVLFVLILILVQLFPASLEAQEEQSQPESTLQKEVKGTNINETAVANCRYGVTTGEQTAHYVTTSGAGVFYKFNEPNWFGELPENGAELMHMLKTRQRKTAAGVYLPEWYIPKFWLNEDLAALIRDDPGAVWIIGNEVERGPNEGETWSARTGDMYPEIYVEAYHDIYHFIKAVDPTARVANAGLIQITPMRLQYLNKMWNAYRNRYGVDMPVDVWTIHTYVLPELTADGQPNNIASVALSTDISLGKRDSGGNGALCPDDQVYCYAEHDDISILREQVELMRTWMKERGQQDKPLIITEYGTLYHYIEKDNGTCGLRDEFGNCFTPERVTQFMLDSFAYLNVEGRSPNLGMPSDSNRLVQQWLWFSVWDWDIGSANLLTDWNSTELTMMGRAFRDHVQAEQPYVNLTVEQVSSSVVAYDEDDLATVELAVSFRNNGNASIEQPFKVTFYRDEGLTEPIGSTTIEASIRGCATKAYTAQVTWSNLQNGAHPFWVKVDSENLIAERPGNVDNVGSGEVMVTGPVYTLDIDISSDGQGTGGVVASDPDAEAHAEGTMVTLTAVPFAGWQFTGWTGALVSSNPIAEIVILEDTQVTAHFKQDQYKIALNITGSGEVKISPESNNGTYLYGDEVTLLAMADEGWRFNGWSGDIEGGMPSTSIQIEGDVQVTATFEELVSKLEGVVYMPVGYKK